VAVPVTPFLVSFLVSTFDLASLYLHLFTRVIKFHCKINDHEDFSKNDAVLGAPSVLVVEAKGVELDSEVSIEDGGRF
jgi:hypothetical protein